MADHEVAPMTGPEHYKEAEKLLRASEDVELGGHAEWLVATAQVHATLAAAAATIASKTYAHYDAEAWRAVIE